MTDKEAQQAIEDAEGIMDDIEELASDLCDYLGHEQVAHFLQSLATTIETYGDCAGEA